MDIPSRLVAWGVVLLTTTACSLVCALVPGGPATTFIRVESPPQLVTTHPN